MAEAGNTTYANLIRKKIDEMIVYNGFDEKVKAEIKQIIKDLKMPFAYFKAEPWISAAKLERERRKKMCESLENIFDLGED